MKSICAGQLSNGVQIEIVEAESLSGRSEFGIRIGGQVVSVSSVSKLRNGDVVVKTVSKIVRIKSGQNQSKITAENTSKHPPDLSDIAKT